MDKTWAIVTTAGELLFGPADPPFGVPLRTAPGERVTVLDTLWWVLAADLGSRPVAVYCPQVPDLWAVWDVEWASGEHNRRAVSMLVGLGASLPGVAPRGPVAFVLRPEPETPLDQARPVPLGYGCEQAIRDAHWPSRQRMAGRSGHA